VALEVDEVSRRLVIERAGRRCEYCLVHEDSAGFPHQIDHIISRKHGVPRTRGLWLTARNTLNCGVYSNYSRNRYRAVIGSPPVISSNTVGGHWQVSTRIR
jgi:hypothetical protein